MVSGYVLVGEVDEVLASGAWVLNLKWSGVARHLTRRKEAISIWQTAGEQRWWTKSIWAAEVQVLVR